MQSNKTTDGQPQNVTLVSKDCDADAPEGKIKFFLYFQCDKYMLSCNKQLNLSSWVSFS